MHEEWFTVQEIADRLRVHVDTVRRWLRDGRLKGRNFGGKMGYRVRAGDLAAFLEDGRDGEGKAAA